MLSFLYNFFRRLFGKKTEVPSDKETPVLPEEIVFSFPKSEAKKPDLIEVADIKEQIRRKQQEKHAKRLAKRTKKSEKSESVKQKFQITKSGIPLLSQHHDFTELFKVSEHKTESRTKELSWEEVLLQKEEVFSEEKPVTVQERLKQYPEPNEELDLHGCTGAQAVIRTEAFIFNAIKQKLKTVRVVVGKGLHSEGKAVLKEVIEDKLARMRQEGIIFNFRWEKERKLKSGAIIVYLHTDKEAK